MKCDVCQKEMTSPNGENVIGVSLVLYDKASNQEYHDFLQKQLGEFELDHLYNVCWACLLLSLGVRPTKRAADAIKPRR